MNYYNNLRDKQQHCILTRFSTFSHDNGCLFQIVSVMWKDNSVPQLWLALMHDVSIISCLQLFAWWPKNVTFRTLEKGALKKMLTLFPFFKICSISCCFFFSQSSQSVICLLFGSIEIMSSQLYICNYVKISSKRLALSSEYEQKSFECKSYGN